MIRSEDLSAWLEPLRPDAAAWLRSQMIGDANPDLRLLGLCLRLLGQEEMPLVWRGRQLSAQALAAAARSALGGDLDSRSWLESLRDGQCFDFYSPISPEARSLGENFRRTVREYEDAWRRTVEQGAPADARLQGEEGAAHMLAEAVQLAFEPAAGEHLRRAAAEFFAPQTILVREPWFLCFGTNRFTIGLAELKVLQYLDRPSLIARFEPGVLTVDGGLDESRLRQGVPMPESHRVLMQKLVVPPGARIMQLNESGVFHSRETRSRWGGFRRGAPPAATVRRVGWRQLLSRALRDSATWTPSLRLRMVRLTGNRWLRSAAPAQDESYLLLIRWGSPADAGSLDQVTLCLDQPGSLGSIPRLRLRELPPCGQIQLIVTADTRVMLRLNRRARLLALESQPIDIRFAPHASLRSLADSLREPDGELDAPRGDLQPVRGELRAAVVALKPARPELRSVQGRLRRPDRGGLRRVRGSIYQSI